MPLVVLVSNGPGELYTWVEPVVRELRRRRPDLKVAVTLIPCQFASGNEAAIAESFAPDAVTTPAEYARAAAVGAAPRAVAELADGRGVVVGLGGNGGMAVALGKRLGYPAYRYSFEPYWHRGLSGLLVPSGAVRKRALRRGAPQRLTHDVGNLVADAVGDGSPAESPGSPHVLLFGGSRPGFAVHLIPLLIATVDRLAAELPDARFVWPVSRLLSTEAVEDGVSGRHASTLGGMAGRREGRTIVTPAGGRLEMVDESDRYAHMRATDVAVTIPGTNTLELGVAGVPALVLLPMNKPEIIPLEGAGHWLGLVPFVGKYLKRYAVKLFVEGLKVPVSLPNRVSGEDLMIELKGQVSPALAADAVLALLRDEAGLARRRERLAATMPARGAAANLLELVLTESGLGHAGTRDGSRD